MAEAVMLLSGLLFTVSAEALLNAPCIDGNGCESTVEKADLLLWTFAVGTELLSVGCSVATCNIISTLSDEDLRVWVCNHWLRYQSAQLWMTLNTGWILPTSIIARLSMHAPSHLIYISIGIFFVLLGFMFNGFWMVQFQGATEITLKSESRIPFWEFNSANNMFIGASAPKYAKMEKKLGSPNMPKKIGDTYTRGGGVPKIHAVDESNEFTPLTPTSAARRKKTFSDG